MKEETPGEMDSFLTVPPQAGLLPSIALFIDLGGNLGVFSPHPLVKLVQAGDENLNKHQLAKYGRNRGSENECVLQLEDSSRKDKSCNAQCLSRQELLASPGSFLFAAIIPVRDTRHAA